MRRLTVFVNSLGGGGSERQAAFIADGLLARDWDVDVLVVHDRNEFGASTLDARVRILGKSSRFDMLQMVARARDAIDPASVILSFNWYPSAIAHMALPQGARVIRFGGTPSADGVTGLRQWMASRAVRTCDVVLGCSWGVTRAAVAELGSPRMACGSIPNAVHFSRATSDTFQWPRPYIVSVGRLSAEKDHVTLLEAYARIAQHHAHDLLIAGDGVLAHSLRQRAAQLGLADRVYFLGHREELTSLYRGADVLVHTSRWEGFGMVLIEAMAQGTPVVATDAPWGPRSILEAVPAGVLVPVGDVSAVARETAALLDDPVRRRELGDLGARRVPIVFDPERIIDAYDALLTTVARERGVAL